jgi:hypothetical protein
MCWIHDLSTQLVQIVQSFGPVDRFWNSSSDALERSPYPGNPGMLNPAIGPLLLLGMFASDRAEPVPGANLSSTAARTAG